MPSRRDQIRMSDGELRDFLDEQRIVSVATLGPHGRPHLVPLWYVRDGHDVTGWTYAKSQKAKNLERDPRATLQVEDGVSYGELRGVMLRCEVRLHREPAEVERVASALVERYTDGGPEAVASAQAAFAAQVPKRVGLEFVEQARVTWDHRKLGGGY